MMYFDTHPDGSMTRKLKEDWTDEEKTLFERHQAFLKEAEALGYVFRSDVDTQDLVGRFAPRAWKWLTEEDIEEVLKSVNTKFISGMTKPYGYVNADGRGFFIFGEHQFHQTQSAVLMPIYAYPPNLESQGLTEGERKEALEAINTGLVIDAGVIARAIEAKLKEKNSA